MDTVPRPSWAENHAQSPEPDQQPIVAEEFDLLDALWENIEAQSPVITEEHPAEFDRRMTNDAQDPSAVVPWEQVTANLFKK